MQEMWSNIRQALEILIQNKPSIGFFLILIQTPRLFRDFNDR
jgi:hypothetical protein